MRFQWPAWGGRDARRSRPRVAQAIQAARTVQASEAVSAARVGGVWGMESAAPRVPVMLAGISGPLRHERAVVSPALLWATAQAARETGRQPADIWTEALSAWLIDRDTEEEQPVRSPFDARRSQAWQAIDATLGELRAS
jgi:hypothetical protein